MKITNTLLKITTTLMLVLPVAACGAGDSPGPGDEFQGDTWDVADATADSATDTEADTAADLAPDASVEETSDTTDHEIADVSTEVGEDIPPSRYRRVRVLDFAGNPVEGAPVLRHDAQARLQEHVATDADGRADVGFNDGDIITAPIYFQAGSILNWVSIFGFESEEHLIIGKPARTRNEVGRSMIRVQNLEPDERVAVHTPCDATTLWDERPSAEFRWYDNCVSGDVAMVIATTHYLGVPDVILRSTVVDATVGGDVVLDSWDPPTVVEFSMPPEVDAFEDVAVEVKDRGFGVRRFFASPGQTSFHAALAGRWQLQFWAYRGNDEVFVMKNLAPANAFEVLSGELLSDQTATVEKDAGLVRLTYPTSGEVDLRSTVLAMGDPCIGIGYYHNVISDGRVRDLLVPVPIDQLASLVPTAHSEVTVRYSRLDPVMAILTLGIPSQFPSPDLSGLHAAAGAEDPEVLSATRTVHGRMSCH
jgi:hypothetical protein